MFSWTWRQHRLWFFQRAKAEIDLRRAGHKTLFKYGGWGGGVTAHTFGQSFCRRAFIVLHSVDRMKGGKKNRWLSLVLTPDLWLVCGWSPASLKRENSTAFSPIESWGATKSDWQIFILWETGTCCGVGLRLKERVRSYWWDSGVNNPGKLFRKFYFTVGLTERWT